MDQVEAESESQYAAQQHPQQPQQALMPESSVMVAAVHTPMMYGDPSTTPLSMPAAEMQQLMAEGGVQV
jgi:hypothetical protein